MTSLRLNFFSESVSYLGAALAGATGVAIVTILSRGVSELTTGIADAVVRQDSVLLKGASQKVRELFVDCLSLLEEQGHFELEEHPAFHAGRLANVEEFASAICLLLQNPDLATAVANLSQGDKHLAKQLAKRELSQRQILDEGLIGVNKSTVSHRLNLLLSAGIVERRQAGREAFWKTTDAARDELGLIGGPKLSARIFSTSDSAMYSKCYERRNARHPDAPAAAAASTLIGVEV